MKLGYLPLALAVLYLEDIWVLEDRWKIDGWDCDKSNHSMHVL